MSRNKRKTLHKHRSANAWQKSYNKNMKPNGDRRTLLRKTDWSERVREIVRSYTYAGVRYVKLTLYTLDPSTAKALVYQVCTYETGIFV